MAPSPWQPVAGATYVGTAASTRFPVYTRGNAGEVYPDVVYPLTFSTAIARAEQAWIDAMVDTGLFSHAELAGEQAITSGVFGGYAYLNLSFARGGVRRLAGAQPADVDRTVFGLSDAPPYQQVRGDRSVRAALRGARWIARSLRRPDRELRRLAIDERRVRAWERSVPPPADAGTDRLRAELQTGIELGAELFRHHIHVTNQAGVPAAVVKLCREALGDEGLGLRLIAGLGEVASAAPSLALWDLGRLVAADPALTAHFDDGIAGLAARLRGDPAAVGFLARFDTFLAEFGSRGPNEWESAADVWGTRPELALTLIDRMRLADATHDPRRRHAALAADRDAARAELDRRAGPLVRLQVHLVLDRGSGYLQGREQAKTTIVRAIGVVRLILRELGRRSAATARAAGQPDAADDDIWFVVEDELDRYLADPVAFAPAIAERRAMRRRLAERIPPFVFEGEPPPWEQWARRDDVAHGAPLAAGDELRGIGGAPGLARGRARVVTDPAQGDLEPGEVLVAPITDPAWTPLFVPAAAVVVDVGAVLSHAVIVARELGIPAVVSATGATRRLRDGDLIEVDGSRGVVTVLTPSDATMPGGHT
ncbi:MAG: PEP-utilizing enzyme [Acidimicrobiales bacterium]